MQYIKKQILASYPNLNPEWLLTPDGKEVIHGPVLIKTDMGSGRLVADRVSIQWRKTMRKKEYILFGSSPNATAVNAEMDDMYTSYKGLCKISTQRCYNAKLQTIMLVIRGRRINKDLIVSSKAIALYPDNTPMITHGLPGDHPSKSPFKTCFSKTNILKPWSNVDFIPFTRKCLKNKSLWREIYESNLEDSKLEDLNLEYEVLKDGLKESGLKEEAFHIKIPIAQLVDRKSNKEDQVAELMKFKMSFKTDGLFLHTKNMIFNSDAILEAQTKTLDLLDEQKKKTEDDKVADKQAMIEEALVSYENYHKKVNKDKVTLPDYKAMMKFCLHVIREETSVILYFKNKA